MADGSPANGSTGMMREEQPRVLAIAAHPDDADIQQWWDHRPVDTDNGDSWVTETFDLKIRAIRGHRSQRG